MGGLSAAASRILVAYEIDSAGNNTASRLFAQTLRAQLLPVPILRAGEKDITDFDGSGGSLRQWTTHAICVA